MTDTASTPLAQPGLQSLSKSFEPVALEAHWGPEWEKRGYGVAGYRGTQAPKEGPPAFAPMEQTPKRPSGPPLQSQIGNDFG